MVKIRHSDVLFGHNVINFDKRFVHALWDSEDCEFPCDLWVDTMNITRDYLKNQGQVKPKVKLADACDHFGIKRVRLKPHCKDRL